MIPAAAPARSRPGVAPTRAGRGRTMTDGGAAGSVTGDPAHPYLSRAVRVRVAAARAIPTQAADARGSKPSRSTTTIAPPACPLPARTRRPSRRWCPCFAVYPRPEPYAANRTTAIATASAVPWMGISPVPAPAVAPMPSAGAPLAATGSVRRATRVPHREGVPTRTTHSASSIACTAAACRGLLPRDRHRHAASARCRAGRERGPLASRASSGQARDRS